MDIIIKYYQGFFTFSLFEYLLLSHEGISPSDYHYFEQSKKIKVIYVDQFDDSLWQGHDILEPTKQMREYKKISN